MAQEPDLPGSAPRLGICSCACPCSTLPLFDNALLVNNQGVHDDTEIDDDDEDEEVDLEGYQPDGNFLHWDQNHFNPDGL